MIEKNSVEKQYMNWLVVPITVAIFAIYARTTAPTIVGGDAGELVAEGCGLGTAHPPGYPVFTLIMHMVTMWLPNIGEFRAAHRANLVCAGFGSLAAGFLAECVVICIQHVQIPGIENRILQQKHELHWDLIFAWCCGSCAAGLWAFSPLVWQYAVTAEVFSLNNLLCALIVRHCLLFAIGGAQLRDARKGAFFVGLALTNQHTAVLFAFPISIWVLISLSPQFISIARALMILIQLGFCGLLGLSPYCYLPISALYSPHAGSWGHVIDMKGFWHHFIRADYGSIQLYSGGSGEEGPFQRCILWFQDFYQRQLPQSLKSFSMIGCIVIGILYLLFSPCWLTLTKNHLNKNQSKTINEYQNSKKKKKNSIKKMSLISDHKSEKSIKEEQVEYVNVIGFLLVFTLLFYLSIFHYLSNMPLNNPLLFGIHARFWQQPNWLMCLFLGVGLYLILNIILLSYQRISSHIFSSHDQPSSQQHYSSCLRLLCVGFTLYLILLQISANFEISDQSENRFFEGYAKSVLASLPPNSVLLINYDQQWTSARYFQVCEGVAPEVTIINLSMMSFKWWEHKRKLYPHIKWTGTHYSGEGYNDRDGFTFEDFVASNINQFEGGIYLGGALSFKHESWTSRYQMVPFGMLNRVLPLRNNPISSPNLHSLEEWEDATTRAWDAIFTALPTIPLLPGHNAKYSEETWEWTIGREFLDHLGDHGAYLLEQTLEDPSHGLFNNRLITACSWFELQINLDPQLKTSTLKNVGLSYMHLVKSASLTHPPIPQQVNTLLSWAQHFDHEVNHHRLKFKNIILNSNDQLLNSTSQNLIIGKGADGWKSWCSNRFIWSWGEFLKRPDAVHDNSYTTIKNIFETVSRVATQSQPNAQISPNNPAPKKRRKKKKKQDDV